MTECQQKEVRDDSRGRRIQRAAAMGEVHDVAMPEKHVIAMAEVRDIALAEVHDAAMAETHDVVMAERTTLSWRNARRHHGATVHSPRPTNRHSPPPKTAHPACKEKHACPYTRKELT